MLVSLLKECLLISNSLRITYLLNRREFNQACGKVLLLTQRKGPHYLNSCFSILGKQMRCFFIIVIFWLIKPWMFTCTTFMSLLGLRCNVIHLNNFLETQHKKRLLSVPHSGALGVATLPSQSRLI